MKNSNKKIFIEALEQRIMLDGAGASTFLDIIDDRNKDKILQKNSKKITKFSENKIDDKSQTLPFDQVSRDQKRNDRKQIVFIDSQVQNYQTLINAFNEDTEVYLIQSNEDGFKRIDNTLKDNSNISSLHIIGHGSAGKILFGNATLSNDTIQSYNQTLRSIGQCLTVDGDILFYGCNVASTDGGKTLISKISELTKADIAASDDLTGKGGDWKLEKKLGIVETENVTVVEYDYNLGTFVTASAATSAASVNVNADGITSIAGATSAYTGSDATSFDFRSDIETGGSVAPQDRWMVVKEKTGITSGTITGLLAPRTNGSGTVLSSSARTATSSDPFDVYSIHLNRDWNSKSYRYDRIGKITFDNDIIGILIDPDETVDDTSATGIALHNTNATYPGSPHGDRDFESFEIRTFNSGGYGTDNDHDFVAVSSDLNTIHVGGKNGEKGDYIRVIVAGDASNNAPVAANDTGTVNEDATLSVSDGASSNSVASTTHDSSPFDVSSQEANPRGLTFSHDGTKMFVCGVTGDDINEYNLSTAFDVSTASFVDSFSVSSKETDPMSVQFNNDGTKMFITGTSSDAVHEYTLTTGYDVSTASFESSLDISSQDLTPFGLAFNNDGTKMFVTGNSGNDINEYTLSTGFDLSSTVNFIDSFSINSQDDEPFGIAFSIDGKKMFIVGTRGNDINEYDLTTGFDVSTASFNCVLSVSSQEGNPSGIAFNKDGTKMFVTGNSGDEVNEYTLTSPFSLCDVTGEHDGDVLGDDTDADGDTLTVSAIRTGSSEGSGTAGTVGSALTGTYGQLTLNSNGSYTYVANQSAADDLDPGDVVTDTFNYTVSDGNGGTDIAVITITVIGINDDPVGVNDTDSVNEDATVTQSSGSGLLVADDTDADDSASFTVTAIKTGGEGLGATTAVTHGSTYNSGGTSVTGTYGTLTLGADGTYTYIADQSAADDLDASDTVTDTFTYTVSDGTATDTATLIITVTGVNDTPVAQNDVGYIKEGGTLTVDDGDNANVSGSYDATGEHSGDVINTSSGSHSDSDVDDSASLVVSAIRTGSIEGSGTAGTLGSGLSGTYGTLTMNANGSYTYVSTANSVSGTVTDVFNYTLSDGTATDIATLTITIYNSNDPVAANNTGTVNEDATLSVSDGASSNSVTSASFVDDGDNDPFEIHNQDGKPVGIRFSNDGKTLLMVGATGVDVNEYTLTTAFDISTSSYVRNYSVSSQESQPRDIAFNSDGTKMFIIGGDGNTIELHEYALSTAYSLSSVSHTASTAITSILPGGSQCTDAYGIDFNTDGTKFFITGRTNNNVYEFTVSSGFDLTSTVAYDSALDIASEAGAAQNIRFNNDGTKMFIVDNSGNDVNEYTLTTGFDISTASHKGQFSVNSQDGTPVGLDFNKDGTKMFVAGWDHDDINEYTLTSPFNLVDVTGEHDGDVLGDDTDADGDTLTVASVRTGSSEGNGTAGSVGSALTGTYGQLTLNSNGSYTYVANQSAADDLDAGDVVTDSFNYTVQDGNGGTDIATIVITVIGINDAPVAVNDTDAVNEDATITQSSGSSLVMADDTDADDSASITVTQIAVTGGSNSAVSGGSSYNSSGTSITGTYGTLVIGADGTYTYTADQSAADDLDASDTATDSFTYTVSDGTATDTATLIITVTGVNDTPVAQNDVGHIVEGATLTVDDGDNANVSGSYDATGEHSGDVINTSSGSHSDSDADDSASLVVSAIRTGGSEGSGTAGTLGSGLSGTYGTLTMNANGSYTYVAGSVSSDVTDVFNYTVSDGTATDTATLTITIYNNNDPVARNDVGVISEDGTLSVSNSANANVSGSYDATGEHSGDVLQTSSTTHYDTDADSDTLVVASVRTGGTEGSGTAGTLGSALTGTYGQLTLNANGSYTYVANQSAADVLDTGDTASDVFNYTVSDGNGGTDTATITITILGVEDAPTAGNETIYINENNTDATHGTRTSGNTTHTFADSDFTNYTDPDDDVGIKIKSLPSTGTLTKISNGAELSVNDTITNMSNLLYTPDANSEADDSFTFRAYDGTSVEGTTYTVTISVNAAPVAVNDTASITAGDSDATGNVITNDTDSDDATSVMSIKGVGAGAEASTLPNSNVGSSVSGTYGNLTINSAGAYTYSVTDNSNTIALGAGETATDVFSYKVRDDETNAGSKALDIGTITFTVTGIDGDSEEGGTTEEKDDKLTKKEKKEAKRQKREERKALKKAKKEKRLEKKEFKLPKSILNKKGEFNQGLKLVDLVAESKSIELKDKNKDVYVDKILAKFSDGSLNIKFKVFNDDGKEVQKYYGVMKDGSPLPDWIKVDPKTGKTKTNIPNGVKMVEFKIIAIDEDNNKKQVTVVIDANKIAKDKEILKQSRKTAKANKIEVQVDGSVKLNSVKEDGTIDKTTTSTINNIESFEDLIKTTKPDEFFKLESKIKGDSFVVELPDKIKNNFENFKIVLKDGQKLPEWIKYNLDTGEIVANPPKNVESIDLKIIVEDLNGEIKVKDLKVDFSTKNTNNSELIINNDTKFVSLSNQLSKEYTNWNDYGSQIIDSL